MLRAVGECVVMWQTNWDARSGQPKPRYMYKSVLDLSDMSDAMNDQTADRWSLGMWPTSSPASLTPRFAASGLDLAHTPESRALMPSTASLVRRLCLSFGLG